MRKFESFWSYENQIPVSWFLKSLQQTQSFYCPLWFDIFCSWYQVLHFFAFKHGKSSWNCQFNLNRCCFMSAENAQLLHHSLFFQRGASSLLFCVKYLVLFLKFQNLFKVSALFNKPTDEKQIIPGQLHSIYVKLMSYLKILSNGFNFIALVVTIYQKHGYTMSNIAKLSCVWLHSLLTLFLSNSLGMTYDASYSKSVCKWLKMFKLLWVRERLWITGARNYVCCVYINESLCILFIFD